jgi:hypothetical protein
MRNEKAGGTNEHHALEPKPCDEMRNEKAEQINKIR